MKFRNDLNPRITEEILIQFEKQIGWDLPSSYREFLLDHNGGVPERKILIIPGCRAETTIFAFRGINRCDEDLLETSREWFSEFWGKYMPIAYDGGANELLLDRRDGRIWYWDSVQHFPSSSDAGNIYLVASSFDDLLNKLTLSPVLPID